MAGFKSFAIFCFLFRTFCAKRFREEMILAHILLYGQIERNYSEQAVFKSLKEVTNNSKYKNPKTRRESGKICNIFFIAQSIYFTFYLVLDWYYVFRNTSQVSSTGRRPSSKTAGTPTRPIFKLWSRPARPSSSTTSSTN